MKLLASTGVRPLALGTTYCLWRRFGSERGISTTRSFILTKVAQAEEWLIKIFSENSTYKAADIYAVGEQGGFN
jgi:hypothetical protein